MKKSIFKKWWFWVIVVVFVIAIASSGDKPKKETTSGQPQQNQQEVKTTEKPEEPEFFKIGETVSTKKVKAIVSKIEKTKGNNFFKPEEGKEFVFVHMTIENTSNSDLALSTILSFSSYVDDNSINASVTALSSKGSSETMDGTLAPGKKKTGYLAYEVPKDWKKLEVHFKPDVITGTTIKWLIENN